MKIKIPVCGLVIFSIWISLFAPFVSAQNSDSQVQSGLNFRISEGAKENGSRPTSTSVQIENLSQTEAEVIFRRLLNMPVKTEENADFRMRADSLKPPRTGKIIPIKFRLVEILLMPPNSSFQFTRPQQPKLLQLTAQLKQSARLCKPFLRRKTSFRNSAVWKSRRVRRSCKN